MPPDPNAHLSDEMLVGVTGGSRRHPNDRGPLGTASTASSIPSTISTYGCSTARD